MLIDVEILIFVIISGFGIVLNSFKILEYVLILFIVILSTKTILYAVFPSEIEIFLNSNWLGVNTIHG